MLYFLLWSLGATVYLIYRSGWRGLLTAGLHGIGMTLLMAATFYATFLRSSFRWTTSCAVVSDIMEAESNYDELEAACRKEVHHFQL